MLEFLKHFLLEFRKRFLQRLLPGFYPPDILSMISTENLGEILLGIRVKTPADIPSKILPVFGIPHRISSIILSEIPVELPAEIFPVISSTISSRFLNGISSVIFQDSSADFHRKSSSSDNSRDCLNDCSWVLFGDPDGFLLGIY